MTVTRDRSRSRSRSRSRPPSGARPARRSRPSQDRFAERRRVARRQRGARRFRIVAGLTAVTTLALGTIALLNSTWMDVDAVTVTGADRADPATLIASSGIEVGQPLVDLDLDGATAAVAAEPWVGTVDVRRSWDGTIVIAITERGPVATLPAGARFALVDDRGRQLEIVDERPAGFLPIAGVEASGVAGEPAPPEAAPVVSVLLALTPPVEDQVVRLEVDGSDVVAALAAGGTVRFGDDRELGAKMQALETVLGQVDLACVATIDLSVPSAPAVVRNPEPC